MKRILLFCLILVASRTAFAAEPHPHRLLLVDESRARLHFVNLDDASKNWEILFPKRYRDVQLIGHRHLLVSTDAGFAEYDFDSQRKLSEFHDARLAGTESVRRLADGRTIVGCNQSDPEKKTAIAFFEFDRDNKPLRSARFPGLSTLRLFRLSSRGTFMFGANGKFVVEAAFDGTILRKIEVKDGGHVYHFFERPDGHLMIGGGYGSFVAELDADGKQLRRWGGKPGPADVGFHFFGSVQVLKDGRIIVANWTGHGAQDSEKGHQVLEFAPDGKLLWSWHDAKLTGSVHGAIALDDLDLEQLQP